MLCNSYSKLDGDVGIISGVRMAGIKIQEKLCVDTDEVWLQTAEQKCVKVCLGAETQFWGEAEHIFMQAGTL